MSANFDQSNRSATEFLLPIVTSFSNPTCLKNLRNQHGIRQILGQLRFSFSGIEGIIIVVTVDVL